MSVYFTSSPPGFYLSAVHGARLIEVLDPDWVRPTIRVVLAPGESVSLISEMFTNETDEVVELDAPDLLAEHPRVTVENPACSIPPAAIEITESLYAELKAGQGKGLVIAADADGFPILVSPPGLTTEELAAIALAERDRRLAVATARIAPLQDAVDLGEATALEEAALLDWKRYRISLNRITQQDGYPAAVVWPEPPAAS